MIEKLPSKIFDAFLLRFNDNRYRRDLSQLMKVKRAGGTSTKVKLFWVFDLSEHGTRTFSPKDYVVGVIRELNWRLWMQKAEAQFELDDYVIQAGQAKFVFEITLKRTS